MDFPNGLLVTNFHVVVAALENPKKYSLVIDELGPVRVIAIDPVHDLAVVATQSKLNHSLPLSPRGDPNIGETIYSIGYPKSEDITIVLGTYNGTQLRGLAAVTAASVAINPGMSGGPTLDSYGRVIGVNRAILRNAQSISYLSPLGAIYVLLEKAKKNPAHLANGLWRNYVESAIRAQESSALAERSAVQVRPNFQKVAGVAFALPFEGIGCGQDFDQSAAGAIKGEKIICRSMGLSMINSEIESLKLETFGGFSSSKFDPNSGFADMLGLFKSVKQRIRLSSQQPGVQQKNIAQKCELRNVLNKHGTQLVAQYCSMILPHFPGLYTTFLKVRLKNSKGQEVNIGQTYEGFTRDTTIRLMTAFLDSIREEPS